MLHITDKTDVIRFPGTCKVRFFLLCGPHTIHSSFTKVSHHMNPLLSFFFSWVTVHQKWPSAVNSFSRQESGGLSIWWHGEGYTYLGTKKPNQIYDRHILTRIYDYVLFFFWHIYNRTVICGCKLDDCMVRDTFVGSGKAGDVGTGYGERMRVRMEAKENQRRCYCFVQVHFSQPRPPLRSLAVAHLIWSSQLQTS